MKIEANSVEDYLNQVPEERSLSFRKLYETISQNLPPGFQEKLSYGMIGWSIPLETYAAGYHCTPNTALPFINWLLRRISPHCTTWEFTPNLIFSIGL